MTGTCRSTPLWQAGGNNLYACGGSLGEGNLAVFHSEVEAISLFWWPLGTTVGPMNCTRTDSAKEKGCEPPKPLAQREWSPIVAPMLSWVLAGPWPAATTEH